jgi:polar amino acid transport system substrate-binding protein
MLRSLAMLLICVSLGCDYPQDADETFRRVQNGVIRAGVVENRPWVNLDGNAPSGIEPQLVQMLAESLGAQIKWTVASETMLVEQLEERQLDLVIGGLTKEMPWSDRVGVSRWYVSATDPVTEKKRKHVWAVMPGESRWLLEVDRFLQSHRDQASNLVMEAQALQPGGTSQ